nr:hypothetical protein [Micromonospora sp. DSM 115978]
MGDGDNEPTDATSGGIKDLWSFDEERRLGDSMQAAHDRDAKARALRRRLEEGW